MYLHVIEYPNYPKVIPGIKFTKISGYQKLYQNNLLYCILKQYLENIRNTINNSKKTTQNTLSKLVGSQGLYEGNTKAVLKDILKN